MMFCLWILMAISITINHSYLRNSITERNLKETQAALDSSCDRFSNSLYSISEISSMINVSNAYNYILGVNENELPPKYITIATSIRDIIKSQLYILGEYSQFLCYIPNTNTVITGKKISTPEEFFSNNLYCSETSNSSILSMLSKRGSHKIFPSQSIATDSGSEPENQFMVLSHPKDSSIGILIFYKEDAFMKNLNSDSLPDGSFIKLTDENGQLLDLYAVGTEDQIGDENDYHILSSKMKLQFADVTVFIPKVYYSGILNEESRNSFMVSLGFAVIGLILALAFSKLQASPIQQIVSEHGIDESADKNEILAISNLLSTNRSNSEAIRQRLTYSQLIRLFSGGTLMENEAAHLENDLPFESPYRIAVVQCDSETGLESIRTIIKDSFENTIIIPISRYEAGLLCPGSDSTLSDLVSLQNKFEASDNIRNYRFGISAVVTSLNEFLVGLRQAHSMAHTRNKILVYKESNTEIHKSKGISWVRHEQFHQSILSEKKDTALSLLMRISSETDENFGIIVYNELAFVIISAAEELSLSLSQISKYDDSKSFSDNIMHLSKSLNELFDLMKMKKKESEEVKMPDIISFINESYSDPGLCLSKAADTFSLKENAVNDLVRKNTQLSFNEYLLYVRMKRAAELLKRTNISVSEVYGKCGYSAESTFFRLFKQYYGMSPKKYRDSH